ncbi:hypothetical protein [Sanyastnella coralliicola]|uniref:hypothetical protein n=1 Tax=Sanyastnella coralliicola TaxID=3069118 RepID=UPI0027BA0399|nr:hypothetical protein [Longitalea sp. SCSIO 12813]
MKKTVLLFFLLGATIPILLSSCSSRVLVNNAMRSELHLTRNQLIGLPVENSGKITLYAAEPSASLYSSGAIPQEITIPKGTPGVVVFAFANKLVVRFEYGEGKTLVFGANDEYTEYKLMAEDWEDGHGSLSYGGATYFAEPGSSDVSLVVDLKDVGVTRNKHHKVRGIKY